MTIQAEPAFSVETISTQDALAAINERTCRCLQNLEVTERDGVIRIYGESHTYYFKQLASDTISRHFPGYSVLNHIKVV